MIDGNSGESFTCSGRVTGEYSERVVGQDVEGTAGERRRRHQRTEHHTRATQAPERRPLLQDIRPR